jgi:hypothetical protein
MKYIASILSIIITLAVALAADNFFESVPTNQVSAEWSSPAAEQSFTVDGDLNNLQSDNEVLSTLIASADLDMYQQYTSGSCTRSTGCSTGCSVGCSTGCSFGCRN